MITGALHVKLESLQGDSIKIYNAACQATPWECNINWDSLDHEHLEENLQDVAWRAASGSAYVEQIGMLTASRLLLDCNDYLLRLNLARAVADEARHTEAFARYAISVKGSTAFPSEGFKPIEDELVFKFDSDRFIFKFLVHSVLEAVAIEEFTLFEELFSSSQLGLIYKMAMIDEARHVAIGINYLQEQVKKMPSLFFSLSDYLNSRYDMIVPEVSTCEVLSRYTGVPVETIKNRFDSRVQRFMDTVAKH
jgi:hypothetical protein